MIESEIKERLLLIPFYCSKGVWREESCTQGPKSRELFPTRNNLIGDILRHGGVMTELEVGHRATFSERAKLCRKSEELRERYLGSDDARNTTLTHRLDHASLTVDHTGHVTHEFLRGHHFELHDRLKQYRTGLF